MAEPAMPQMIQDWMSARTWGVHHLVWHLARRWDLTGTSAHNYVTSNGGAKASRQEGVAGNGMDFLAMHRVMIRQLIQQFPAHAALFAGWAQVPTDPHDPNDPLPNNGNDAFAVPMLAAVDRLQTNISGFATDDELGLYIQTRLRPIVGEPSHLSPDATTGIHNYLHNRFSDPNSEITMGDPLVNINNQRFWRLHGWIDGRWTAFRAAKGLPENEPAYKKALADAAIHLHHQHTHLLGLGAEKLKQALTAPPEAAKHFFELVDERAEGPR